VGLLAVAAYHGALERGPFEDGLLGAVRAYERMLAVLGLGLAASRQAVSLRWSSIGAFAAGSIVGIAGESGVANSAFVAGHLYVLTLPGPIACVIAGLALALPAAVQKWVLPVLAVISGVAIGMAVGFEAPGGTLLRFAAGGVLAGLWLVLIPALLLPLARGAWLRILTRILGSWLIAIGIMLGGVRVIGAKPKLEALPPPAPAAAPLPPSSLPQALPPPAAPRPFKHGRENDFGQP
jgi:hydrogenase/urease accessory protein HupE